MHNGKGMTLNQAAKTSRVDKEAPAGSEHALRIEPYFCPVDQEPFETVEWSSARVVGVAGILVTGEVEHRHLQPAGGADGVHTAKEARRGHGNDAVDHGARVRRRDDGGGASHRGADDDDFLRSQ